MSSFSRVEAQVLLVLGWSEAPRDTSSVLSVSLWFTLFFAGFQRRDSRRSSQFRKAHLQQRRQERRFGPAGMRVGVIVGIGMRESAEYPQLYLRPWPLVWYGHP